MIGLTRSTVPSASRYSLYASLASSTSTSLDREIAAMDNSFTQTPCGGALRVGICNVNVDEDLSPATAGFASLNPHRPQAPRALLGRSPAARMAVPVQSPNTQTRHSFSS
jgi:hypothetical protein